MRVSDMIQIKASAYYVIRQKSTGLYLSDYNKSVNRASFEADNAAAATWISGKCIDGICGSLILNQHVHSQDDIEVLEAPDSRMYI